MSIFLQGLLFCLIGSMGFFCGVVAFAICMRSSQLSRQEEAEGAPEGALNSHFQHPDAPGSTLGVRVHSKSSPVGRG